MTGTRRRIATNGIELDVDEAGTPGNPVVVLLHGFPECSHSWRHQLQPLADAGFHVLAPDQRGYGRSTAPADVDAYRVDHLSNDVLGLLDTVGADDAIVVGHDWGALLVWDLAQLHPQRIRAVVAASVPHTPWPAPPTEVFKQQFGDKFFYILYFQPVGPAESELGADVRRTMHAMMWSASGEMFKDAVPVDRPMEGTGMLDIMAGPDDLDELPSWLPADDFQVFVDRFEASGFFGPISWYRNLDANYRLTRELGPSRLTMPTFFIGGEHDLVTARRPEMVGLMESVLPNHQGSVILDRVGHWMQQEDPGAFNAALLGFLGSL